MVNAIRRTGLSDPPGGSETQGRGAKGEQGMREHFYQFISDEDYAIAEANGINAKTLNTRVFSLYWDIETAITRPVQVQIKGDPWVEKAKEHGIHPNTYRARRRYGWSAEEAATHPLVKKGFSKEGYKKYVS